MGSSIELSRVAWRLVSQSLINAKNVKKAKWINCDKSAGRFIKEYTSPTFSNGIHSLFTLALSEPKVCRIDNISRLAMHVTVF